MDEQTEPQRLYSLPKVKELESNRSRITTRSGSRVPILNHLHVITVRERSGTFKFDTVELNSSLVSWSSNATLSN